MVEQQASFPRHDAHPPHRHAAGVHRAGEAAVERAADDGHLVHAQQQQCEYPFVVTRAPSHTLHRHLHQLPPLSRRGLSAAADHVPHVLRMADHPPTHRRAILL